MGSMKKSEEQKARTDFMFVQRKNPHFERRREILEKYPEIRDLFGICPRTKYVCFAAILVQLTIGCLISRYDPSWYILLPLMYCIGGTINHALSLAGHELSHRLAFKSGWKNDVLGIMCNLVMGFPSTITFRRYHIDHHQYLGVLSPHLDPDVPSPLEAKILSKGRIGKFLFLLTQPLFYSVRPMLVSPKPPIPWEVLNFLCVGAFHVLTYNTLGLKGCVYYPIATLMGLSMHPLAGHFIAEHYAYDDSNETFSYYGPLNLLTFNVGYHVEHHDFPRVPGSRLPKLREIAKEYYPANPNYQSWVGVMWNFLVRKDMGSYSRVVRTLDQYKSMSAADVAASKEN